MNEPISIITTNVVSITIFNFYKPPNEKWPLLILPSSQHLLVYAGDFNNHSNWEYDANDKNGEVLNEWIETVLYS